MFPCMLLHLVSAIAEYLRLVVGTNLAQDPVKRSYDWDWTGFIYRRQRSILRTRFKVQVSFSNYAPAVQNFFVYSDGWKTPCSGKNHKREEVY